FFYHSFSSSKITIPYLVGLGLSFKVDTFRVIYAFVSIFLWMMCVIFSKEYMSHSKNKERYYLFLEITLGGVVGVFFSQDFFTTFIFFELMSFASYPLVIHEENKEAMKAGETYLGVAVISGMLLLVGLFLIYNETQTLDFSLLHSYFANNSLTNQSFAGGILILLGFGAKAGMFPLHIWLPKAHPVAPAPASALLSGILTKTGVFGIIVICTSIFMGNETFIVILLVLAVITMFLGALLGVLSINLKRTLACSSMSQIGFILVGLSFMMLLKEEGGIAQCGILGHMVNHSLIKLVLFLCSGVIAMNIHSLDLNVIKGWGRKKHFLKVIFAIGALGIMGIPLFNGYISKTLIHEAIVEYINLNSLSGSSLFAFKFVEWTFLFSGGLTIAYMSKLFIAIFVEKNESEELQSKYDNMTQYISPLSKGVLIVSSVLLPLIGILPNIINLNIISKANEFFHVQSFTHHINFFSFTCLKGALISIAIGLLVYFVFIRLLLKQNGKYINIIPSFFDLENVYRFLVVTVPYLFIKYVVRYIAYFFEYFLVYGTFYFIVHIVRYITISLDFIFYILSKTIFKAHIYKYEDKKISTRIGEFIDRHASNKPSHYYQKKIDSFTSTLSHSIGEETSTYSFAFAMVSLGIFIILLFAFVVSL
ncbi:MAG: complex I subunit 5 family protein, partial [Bacilli bacterium]